MKARVSLILAIFTALLLFNTSPALSFSYNTLYMATGGNQLYTLDETNGAATLVGNTGVTLTDIAFAGSTLYGVSFSNLYTVNPDTGASTFKVSLGNYNPTNALTASLDGSKLWAVRYDTGLVYTIDPSTNTFTTIGAYGSGLTSAGDLAFDFATGTLYGAVTGGTAGSNFYVATVNTGTGAATLLGSHTGFSGVFGLSFLNGTLYAVTDQGDLATINLGTGVATSVGDNNLPQWGLTTSPVPLPGALLLLGVGLARLAAYGRRRRNQL